MTVLLRRRPIRSLLLILLLVILGWTWHERVALWAFPDIISAYTAKEYCSCRYVMHNDAEYCHAYVKQWLPVSGFTEDSTARRITVNGMGRSNSAVWIGEHEGCRLSP
ncbi:amidase [Pseudomonas sp. NPDC089569]|uniref:amidase n=1 Tax=Pseudomonas sp. NPDC089569 TaxID=3390722 RepID=UPI003CFED40C